MLATNQGLRHVPFFLRSGEPDQRSAARLYRLYGFSEGGGSGGTGAHRSGLGATAAANPPIAKRLVGLSQRRTHALPACSWRHAFGRADGPEPVSVVVRGVPSGAGTLGGLCREPGTPGRPPPRRGSWAIRPLLRRAFP